MAQSFKDESIPIILTHRMTLQDIFDSWYDRYDAYEKAKPKTDKKPKPKKEYDGGIFFYDLEPDEYYKGENMCYCVIVEKEMFALLINMIPVFHNKSSKYGM